MEDLEFNRRSLLWGAGALAFYSNLAAAPADAQELARVPSLSIKLQDKKTAVENMLTFEHWLAFLDLSESYARERETVADEDAEAMGRISAYLIGSLDAKVKSIEWIGPVVSERFKEFDGIVRVSISAAPIDGSKKERLAGAISNEDWRRKFESLKDEARPTAGGVKTSLMSVPAKSPPTIADKELRRSWECLLLRSMLATAVAAGRSFLVTPVLLKLDANGCLPK